MSMRHSRVNVVWWWGRYGWGQEDER